VAIARCLRFPQPIKNIPMAIGVMRSIDPKSGCITKRRIIPDSRAMYGKNPSVKLYICDFFFLRKVAK
jgi:hypothetical protein